MSARRLQIIAAFTCALAPLAPLALAAQNAPLASPPKLAPPPSVKLPPAESRTLANGLKLVIVERHQLPIVDATLIVGTGSEADPAGKAGVASLTAAMLTEGTTTRSSPQIADQAAYLGIELNAASGWDESLVRIHGPTAQLDSALALMADVALRAAFPDSDFARVKKDRLTQLIQVRDRGPQIADRAYASILYGEKHPYGHATTGTEASVTSITRADVRAFHDTYYRPNNATLLVVGDVKPADLERRVAALFGGWARAQVPPSYTPNLAAPAGAAKTTIYLIDKPGAPQSSFRIGSIGVARSTKDYFALEVMNTILGDAFTSRLNQNLRELHGYTYGAFSRFDMRREAGPFTASAEIVAAKSDSALIEFLKELKGIRDTVPSAELAKAKRYIELQLPQAFETTTGTTFELVPLVVYGLPLDFYNTYTRQIDRVSQADVHRVAQRYIAPDKLSIVIVGDRKSIEPGLRALNVGPVELRGIDGAPIAVP